MSQSELSPMHLDALKEIGNIGMGNALTSLSQLVNQELSMTVPQTGFYPLEDVIAQVGGEEKLVSCVILRVLGDIQGTVMFVFDEQSTYLLIDLLMGLPEGSTTMLDEMGQSAVQEVGNVLTGSFTSAIGMLSQLKLVTTVPVFALDMLGAILPSVMIASGRVEDKILAIENELFQSNQKVKGHFFFFADPDAVDKLLEALGLTQ
ncbi:MAG: chemotaxis protein CheC [Firmicutes bacterium]|nr:chemotaxis protein CheC [Bacillota bacterium]